MTSRTNCRRILAFLLLVAGVFSVRFAAHAEDIDLFTINPAISSQRPNVLILLDSSANWDQTDSVAGGKRSTHVLNAMARTIRGLPENLFNVGLMMFSETGNPNDNIDGGVMRMGMRYMNASNKETLAQFFESVDSGFDKSNNTSMGLALAEAYYYYSGVTAYSGLVKAKRDYLGNDWSTVGASQQGAPASMQTLSNMIWNLPLPGDTPLPRNAFTDSGSTVYNPPITDACQKNFIIYIANGTFSDPNASNVEATTRLAAAGGNTTTILFTQNTGSQSNISDEWTKFLANPDPNNAAKPLIVTYAVEVNAGLTGQGPNTSELLKSVGNKNTGNGGYYAVSSAGGGDEIAIKLNEIFAEIAAVNSVFASSTLPVSVNVRGAFLNQVYMGVFRPDANSSPRWPGNVKHYALAANSTGDVFLVDKQTPPVPIENTVSGFVSPSAVSYWTSAGTTFWDNTYYPDTVAKPPLTATTADAPDGEFVEKGGAAQRLRQVYASTINDATNPRKLYTCIGCASGSDLTSSANYAFSTANSNITAALMGITGTMSVTSLTRAGNTVTATSTAHGFTSGQSVTMAGANETEYNGAATVTKIDNDTFTYSITERPVSPATPVSGQTLTAAKGGTPRSVTGITLSGTTATVTTTIPHLFTNGISVTISGADQPEYNGTFTIANAAGSTFDYTVPTGPANPTTPGNIVVTRDGTNGTASSAINTIVRSGTTVTVTTSANVFTGSMSCVSITITGANNPAAPYNGTKSPCTKVGNRELTFTLVASDLTPVTPATGLMLADASVTRTITSMTRPTGSSTVTVVTSAAHTYTSGDTIVISGAAQSLYNGSKTPITVVNATTFTFTVTPQPATPATGTITATGSSGLNKDDVINWARGQNVKLDDNPVPTATLVRGYLHGDVLHSRPAVVNYNRASQPADRDLVVFYGSNDGVIHAIKGGQDDADGVEKWGFVPSEFFTGFARLYAESPIISVNNRRTYFADGPISINAVYRIDNSDPANPQERLDGAGAKAQIYLGMRRGGRFYYSLDVTDPDLPLYKWKLDTATTGFAELGQSWSEAKVVTARLATCPATGASGNCKVLVFGAGYDSPANDPETQGTATMGRGIFVVDATTGERIWHTGPAASSAGTGTYVQTAGMTFAIPADLAVINSDLDVQNLADRIYAADTGGNIWRVNISDSNPANWKVYKVALLRTTGAENARKFLFAPDTVQFDSATDSILIGSGDREHPHETSINNRYYMIKDPHAINNFPAVPGDPTVQDPTSVVTESNLCDLTDNNLQGTDATLLAADKTCLATSKGWMIRLVGKDPKAPTDTTKRSPGEKTVTGATTLGGTVIFATNTPKQTVLLSGQCTGSLGTALIYTISFRDATATIDLNGDGVIGQNEQFAERVGGGFPPTAIPFSTKIGDKYYEGAITGTKVVQPPTDPINQRYRVFWNLGIDN